MPIYTKETLAKERLPWVEIEDFDTFVLGRVPMQRRQHATEADSTGFKPYWGTYSQQPLPYEKHIEPTREKDRIIVLGGSVQVECESGRFTLQKRDYFEIPESGAKITNNGPVIAEVGRVEGHWDHTIRGEICLFQPETPCDYHYHDGDEYWVVFRGHFTLDYNGIKVPMKPGMMMAAGKGFEHGSLNPEEQFQAMVLAMPLEGELRDGHLNQEMHGAPTPGREVPASVWEDLRTGNVPGTV
jgi:mannose-6-phosphate isomerase-like protein (cupin superfamily)